MKPKGMEHHERNFAAVKIDHSVISAIQSQYPQLEAEMVKSPENATNTFMGFVLLLALKNGTPKFPEVETEVIDTYKLVDKSRRTR